MYKDIKKKGISINSIFKFLFRVLDASNLVIRICDVQEKKLHIKKIFLLITKFFGYIDHLAKNLKKNS